MCSCIRLRSCSRFLNVAQLALASDACRQSLSGASLCAWISSSAADAAEPDPGPPAEVAAQAVASPDLSDSSLSDAGTSLATDAVDAVELTGPIGSAISLLEALHSTTGLPWWATIPMTAVGLRCATFPLLAKSMKASQAVSLLFASQAEGRAQQQQPSKARKSLQQQRDDLWQRWKQMQSAGAAPSPAWLLIYPLVQVPIFATAVIAIRRMAFSGWPGFADGGALWFPNLCAPALDWSTMNAPLGAAGLGLPLIIFGASFAHTQLTFGPLQSSSRAVGSVRILLEWLSIFMLVITLQLPQGPVLYWASSATFTLLQGRLLQLPSVREWLGLRPAGPIQPAPSAAAQALTAARHLTPQQSSTSASSISQEPSPAQFPSSPPMRPADMPSRAAIMRMPASEIYALVRTMRKGGEAAAALKILAARPPKDAEGMLLLGQLYSHKACEDQQMAASTFEAAASLSTKPSQKAKAWLQAGLSHQMADATEPALAALREATSISAAASGFSLTASKFSKDPQKQQSLGKFDAPDPSRRSSSSNGSIQHVSSIPSRRSTAATSLPSQSSEDQNHRHGSDVLASKDNEGLRKTLVRALVARASILQGAGRLREAHDLLISASSIDSAVKQLFLDPLERLMHAKLP
ncbi:hypothetical protein WJX74_009107 [Apatococcus lobatus]|uniref:Membrane insertase YidC/Oxa/ALB C-terminal domain-containing protein n=1 Tax=Apatococcus lobatus TaxID=904363 RepID=A0AAW1S5S2_9CHLO